MTDEQIINNLRHCFLGNECRICPLKEKDSQECSEIVLESALDLIYRQKAEIERLNGELQAMRGAANSYRLECERLNKLKEIMEDKNGQA